MFTGIIQEIGLIKSIKPLAKGKEVIVSASQVLPSLKLGDSIAINGACSTAIAITSSSFTVQFLEETLKKTTFSSLKVTQKVNLELSLTPSTHMGGHFVSGHVDDVGKLLKLEKKSPWGLIQIEFKPQFRPYLISKGSITIDGISLTVVDITESTFTCHLIPHTLANTNLSEKRAGDGVNLEYDMIGKYLYNFVVLKQTSPQLFKE